jgi:hypothetical protein
MATPLSVLQSSRPIRLRCLPRAANLLTVVEYFSSAGLRALMAASRQKPRERRLAAARLNALVHKALST